MDFLSNQSDIYTTKVRIMKKIITLFAFVLTALCSSAQEHWNAVKVFDFDPETEREVYNFYIDTTDTNFDEPVFCFQIGGMKLIKTDINGSVLQNSPAPYIYYTIFNGDTLVLKNDQVTTVDGETIASCYRGGHEHNYLAASSMGIYVFEGSRANDNGIINVMNNKERSFISLSSKQISGLCCCGGVVYAIVYSTIIQKNEDLSSDVKTISVKLTGLAGISIYKGDIYVYSTTDKAMYRLSPPVETIVPSKSTVLTEITYYNLSGRRVDMPSGLTIVVSRYSDGSVHTEKKLFR